MKVSIIVPAYNAELYIEKCINSLINQTYGNIEIIVVNDGSTDNTLSILKQFRNIILIDKENSGVSDSRNIGIENATGDFIMFVDSDDWIDLDMIEKLIDNSDNGNIDIIRCGYVREYENKKEYFKIVEKNQYVLDKNEIYEKFIRDYTLASPCCQLIKKSKIKTLFDKNIKIGEDYLFNLDVYTASSSFMFIQDQMYHYLYNNNSATTSISTEKIVSRCNDAIDVYSRLYDYIDVWDRTDLEKKVSTRIIKELNMKLLQIFNVKEEKTFEIVSCFFENEKIKYARKTLTLLDFIKNINLYTLFNICIYKNNKKIYCFLGKIYRNMYILAKGDKI